MRSASFDSFNSTPEPAAVSLNFGKYRGVPLHEIETGYLEWVLTADRVKFNAELTAAIQAEIASRAPRVIDRHSIPSKHDELTMDLARLIVEAGERELRECFATNVRFGQAVEFLKTAINQEPTTNGTLAF